MRSMSSPRQPRSGGSLAAPVEDASPARSKDAPSRQRWLRRTRTQHWPWIPAAHTGSCRRAWPCPNPDSLWLAFSLHLVVRRTSRGSRQLQLSDGSRDGRGAEGELLHAGAPELLRMVLATVEDSEARGGCRVVEVCASVVHCWRASGKSTFSISSSSC